MAMRLVICSVKDQKAEAFMQPIFGQSKGQIMRSFMDEVARAGENNVMNAHPEDFSLWHLGFFDDQSGRIELLDQPECLIRGVDAVNAASKLH